MPGVSSLDNLPEVVGKKASNDNNNSHVRFIAPFERVREQARIFEAPAMNVGKFIGFPFYLSGQILNESREVEVQKPKNYSVIIDKVVPWGLAIAIPAACAAVAYLCFE